MTPTRELVVPLPDVLYAVTLRCSNCNTLITLDLSDPRKVAGTGHFVPNDCPVCKTAFDSAWKRVDALRQAYEGLREFGDQITFRVRLSEQQP